MHQRVLGSTLILCSASFVFLALSELQLCYLEKGDDTGVFGE